MRDRREMKRSRTQKAFIKVNEMTQLYHYVTQVAYAQTFESGLNLLQIILLNLVLFLEIYLN